MLGNGTDSERLPFVLKKLEQVEAAYIKLESQLADRDAEIERLEGELRAELTMARLRIQWEVDAKAEIERLRADLVWAVREDCRLVGRYVWQVAAGYIEYDGTPESICRAVREARDGEADS